jgi:hypothetical protein
MPLPANHLFKREMIMEFNLSNSMAALLAWEFEVNEGVGEMGCPDNIIVTVKEPFYPNYGVTASIAYRHSIASGNQYRTHTGFKNPSLFAQLAWGW